MRTHGYASFSSPAVLVVAGLLIPIAAAGQVPATGTGNTKSRPVKPWTVPLTPDGQPDLQGIWSNNSATPLERPAALAGRPFLSDEEVVEFERRAARLRQNDSDAAAGDAFYLAVLSNVDRYKSVTATGGVEDQVVRHFENRTSLITDPTEGKIPFTVEGQRRQAAAAAVRQRPSPDNPEDLPNDLRCITNGVPRLGGNAAGYNSYYQFVQGPGYVVLVGEVIHDARVIPLDGRPHLPSNIRLWHGDPRGHWEGHTLIVDTTNFSSKSYFLGSRENLHLVERFTRVAEDTINYEITVSDESTWTRPWTALVQLKQTQDRMYEYACHEGNEREMIGMLRGARGADTARTPAQSVPR
jgi:hypothetical protein